MRPFVVTGTGHSGTGWASQVLTAVGVPCGHEQVYRHDGVWPSVEGDSSWLAVGWLDAIPLDVAVVHLVRHPLDVLRSVVRTQFLGEGPHHTTPHARFVLDRRPELDHESAFARQVSWVARWDEPLERRPVRLVVRLEDAGPAVVNEMIRFVGGDPWPWVDLQEVLDDVGRPNCHAHDVDDRWVMWQTVEPTPDGAALSARARRYGYA